MYFVHILLTCSDMLRRLFLVIKLFTCLHNLELFLQAFQWFLRLYLITVDHLMLLLHIKLNQMVLVAYNVFDLINVNEIYFAESNASEISLQTDHILTVQISLHIVQLPRYELVGKAFIFTVPDFLHKCVLKKVFIVHSIPYVVLFRLHCSK